MDGFSKEEVSFFIGSVKDSMQIAFFIVAGTVTILSYLQARKTLFTPIKTEVFKMQVKAFEEILAFFQNKTESDFTELFDLNYILRANARIMFSEFVAHFYKNELQVDKEKMKKMLDGFSGAIVTQSWAEKNFTSFDYFEGKNIEKQEDITNPAIIIEHWRVYEYGPINFTKKYSEAKEKLNLLIASPLIPVKLKSELEKFDEVLSNNLTTVGKLLNEIAQELPHKFPNASSVEKFEPAGIWNKYNRRKEDFEPISSEMLKYIRTYLKVDKIIE